MADARRKRKSRAERMPTEQDAINAMYDAYSRLKELGWNDGIYMPKDGTVVDVIEVASTGIHRCAYSGEWADGFFNIMDDRDVYPTRSVPPLFRPHKPKT